MLQLKVRHGIRNTALTVKIVLIPIIFSGLTIGCTSENVQTSYRMNSERQAVVFEENAVVCLDHRRAQAVNIRTQPIIEDEYLSGFEINGNEKAKVIGESGDGLWLHVETTEVARGWIYKKYFILCDDQTFVDSLIDDPSDSDLTPENDDDQEITETLSQPSLEPEDILNQQLVGFDDSLFTPDMMDQVYRNYLKKPDNGSCDLAGRNLYQCSVDVYRRIYDLFNAKPEWGEYNFGTLMTIVFYRELRQAIGFDWSKKPVVYEAYLRNLWQKICGGDLIEGCNAKELLVFLTSKQAWYARGLIPQHDVAFVESALKEDYLVDMKSYFHTEDWFSLDYRREFNGFNPNVPIDWANWACRNESNQTNGYDYIKDGVVDGRNVPLVQLICDPAPAVQPGTTSNQRYHYIFGIVTHNQDVKLPMPSSGGAGCSYTCPNGGLKIIR